MKKRVKQLRLFSRKKLSLGLGLLAILGGILYILLNPSPVKSIKLVGKLEKVSKARLLTAVRPHLDEGFFGFDVQELQASVLAIPWIKEVSVRRHYPSKVAIYLKEHQIAAVWQPDGIVCQSGDLIFPKEMAFQDLYPVFIGPKGQHNAMLKVYRHIGDSLSQSNVNVALLELAPRGAWKVTLSNGMVVLLGTEDIEERIGRFVKAFPKVLYNKQDKIEYVDLRYTSGMAVGWKAGYKG